MKKLAECIMERKSERGYSEKHVSKEDIESILEAGIWAPSAKNMQPWRFAVISNREKKKELADLSACGKWMNSAPYFIIVFLDHEAVSDSIPKLYLKHVQSIGSAIQNMLLRAYDLGLETCWIGEILKKEVDVKNIVGAKETDELMAVITVGYGKGKKLNQERVPWQDKMISWI